MYQAFFEARPGLAVVILPDSPKFTVVAVSDDLINTTGIERNAAKGLSFTEIFPANVNNQAAALTLRASFESILVNKVPDHLSIMRFDLENKKGGKTEHYWKVTNVPVKDQNEKVQYIIFSAEDITLQVRSENKQRHYETSGNAFNFFMTAPVIIGLLKGDDYMIELANQGLLEVWGRNEEVIGKPLLEAIPELENQGFIELLEDVRTTGNPFYAYEFPITLNRHGVEEVLYFDFIYKPFYENETEEKAAGIISVGHDVTAKVIARKKIEETKKESDTLKRLYETINGSTPDLIYVFDLDYRFKYANQALLNMWGKTWEEAIGKTLIENGYEQWHAEMHEREIDEIIKTKKSIRGTVGFPHATLGERLYDYIFVPVLNESGNVEAIAGTTRDITEIKEADQRFRELADESPMFIFIIDPEPEAPVNYWNKAWLEYTGLTHEEAVGRSWDKIIHPEDIPYIMDIYVPAFKKQAAYILNAVRVLRRDGEYRWHIFKGNPRFLNDGSFNGYVGVGFDVHDQKLAQDQLKQNEAVLQQMVDERTLELENQKNLFDNILKNSSNGITVTEMIRDEKGNVTDARTILANDAAFRYTGLPKEIFLSKTATEIDPGIIQSEYGQTCLQTLKTGVPSLSQYFVEMSGRWQELTISKMDDDHLIHIFTDVTPIKEAQLQLERTNEELKRSNTNLEEFAYAASHDLKEPIRKIRIFSDKLKNKLQEKLTQDDLSYFHRMELASNRMNTLIEDLLQYSYASKGVLSIQPVHLNELVKDVLEDLDIEIEEKKARINIGELPVINGNPRQLQQLFQNLLSNALKYNRQHVTQEISVLSKHVRSDDRMLEKIAGKKYKSYHLIEVKDNGIGFLQEDAEKIFKVFTRLHGNSEYKGSGVGLSIVRKVVENHDGWIWAESVPDEGATFRIILPED